MRNNPLTLRFRYWLDNSLARSLSVVILWVFIALGLLVVATATAMKLLAVGPNNSPETFIESVWLSLTRSLDAGTFGQDEGSIFRLLGLVVTIGGLLAVSTLISLISSAVTQRVERLRRGRTLVMESDHILILGASKKLPIIIKELADANVSARKVTVVALSTMDKLELEDQLYAQLADRHSINIVVRRGEPASLKDLSQVSPQTARSVIILRPDTQGGDAEVVRVALAVHRLRQGQRAIPIVAELDDEKIAQSLGQALSEEVMTVVGRNLVSRVAAQSTKAAGLGAIYQELLDFSGAEIYPVKVPNQLIGRTFGQAVAAAQACSAIGYIRNDETRLVPNMDDLLLDGDEILVVAKDEITADFQSDVPDSAPTHVKLNSKISAEVDGVIVVGWNRYAREAILELDANAAAASRLHLVVDELCSDGFTPEDLSGLNNFIVTYELGSTIDFEILSKAIRSHVSTHILVLASHGDLSEIESDARTLLTLMHIRKILSEVHDTSGSINLVSEIVDPSATELAEIASPDDFIVSLRLVSLLITQLAENPHRKDAIQQILSSNGPSIQMRQMAEYVSSRETRFSDLVSAAAARGECAIGWQRGPGDISESEVAGRINLNPAKDSRLPEYSTTKAILLVP